MALEADPCQLRTAEGELVTRGTIRSFERDELTLDAASPIGPWFHPGDRIVVEVHNAGRGALTYHGDVEEVMGRRLLVRAVHLQTVRQERVAVRVATDLVLEAAVHEETEDGAPVGPRVRIRVVDLSAHGMRLLTPYEAHVGQQMMVLLPTPQGMLNLEAEIVRAEEVPGGWLCGARFVDLTGREQDALFAWVLELQRQILRRRASR